MYPISDWRYDTRHIHKRVSLFLDMRVISFFSSSYSVRTRSARSHLKSFKSTRFFPIKIKVLQSSGAMSQLMAGSSKTMERGTIIKEGVTFGASTSGTGDASASAMWTMGSQATMERTNISKSGPTFGAEYAGTASATGSSSRVTRGCR